MSSHKLRVNPLTTKGEIVLPTINYPIASGSVVMLGDEDFQKSDVQFALKKGLLVEEAINEDIVVPEDLVAEAEESVEKPTEVLPDTDNAFIVVPEDLIAKPPKKKAKVIFRAKNKAGKDINEVVEEINEKIQADEDEFSIDPRDFDDTDTTPLVWDGTSQKSLDVAAGRKKVLNDLSVTDMTVQVGKDIDLGKKEPEEPKPEPVKKKAKKVRKKIKKAKKVKTTSKKKTAKKQTLPIPDIGDIDLVYDESGPDLEDLGFDDEPKAGINEEVG